MSQPFTPTKKDHAPLFYPSSSQSPRKLSQPSSQLSQSSQWLGSPDRRSRSLTPFDTGSDSQSQPLTQERRPTWSQESECNRVEEEEDDRKLEKQFSQQFDADPEYQYEGSSQPSSADFDVSDNNEDAGLPPAIKEGIERLTRLESEQPLEDFLKFVLSESRQQWLDFKGILEYAARCKGVDV